MAEDLEVGVMLEVDESQLEDVEDRQVDVTGGEGGGSTPAQRDQQEQVVAGGVSKGLLAAGVIAGILSQLKVITAPIKAIFGIISRSLIPLVEDFADFLRPFVEGVNEFVQDFQNKGLLEIISGKQEEKLEEEGTLVSDRGDRPVVTPQSAGQRVQEAINPFNDTSLEDIQFDEENEFSGEEQANMLSEMLTDPAKSADQSGEANKEMIKNFIEDPVNLRLGGGNQ